MKLRQSQTERDSALWDGRANALWGQGGRGGNRSRLGALKLAASLAVVVLAAPMFAIAGSSGKTSGTSGTSGSGTSGSGTSGSGTSGTSGTSYKAFVPTGLLNEAKAYPTKIFPVIVQGTKTNGSTAVDQRVRQIISAKPAAASGVKKKYVIVNGVLASLSGAQLVTLSTDTKVGSITRDQTMRMASYANTQQWPYQTQLSLYWNLLDTAPSSAPTIAIVDSGIERRADFGSRIVAEVNMTTLPSNSAGDGRGHGTFVAGIAAGESLGYQGGSPGSKIVSIDVMDDSGMAKTSEVISAADWILANKAKYGIRVANFSLHASNKSSFMYDPLNKAVQRLWFAGVVVVAAAGNYGTNGQPSGVHYAPGNDPFIITAGAYDGLGTMGASDDTNTPWSSYGYTPDGFSKPDVGAPGRYIVGPVPAASTLVGEKPANVTAPGYMQLSGTSFSAPVVTAAAAYVLAKHPGFTPDQVKGALMQTAVPSPALAPRSMGVGEVRADSAAMLTTPPNPNAALNRYLTTDPNGTSTPMFDAVSWSDAAKASASWDSASWSDASWDSASWDSASWSDVSWSDASWDSVSWSDAAAQEAAGLESVSWSDNAKNDFRTAGPYLYTG
jgi:serine protease AprX